VKLNVNGADVEVDDRFAASPLLWMPRDVLGLHGTKYGCGIGYCAACTVLIDGRNTKSCQTPAGRAIGKAVTTVEGASGPVVDAVRDAWCRGNVVQGGYCRPGQTLAAAALLEADRSPDDAAIARWMNGNLCRCGTYPRIRLCPDAYPPALPFALSLKPTHHDATGTCSSGPTTRFRGCSPCGRGGCRRWRRNRAQRCPGVARLTPGQRSTREPPRACHPAVEGRVSIQLTISRRSAKNHCPPCLTNSPR
jgi:isoquinoline 1-oxidoreductase alpha subunit